MTNPVSPAINLPFSAIVAAEAIGLAMLNAVARQQSDSIAAQAVTVMGAATLYSINTAVTATEWKTSLDAATAAAPAVEAEPSIAEAASATIDTIAHGEPTQDAIESAARMIAVSMAISVQDAANYLRNVQTLSTAAIACSLVLQPNTTHPVSLDTPAMSAMASALDRSTAQFEKLCHQATDILAQLRPLLSAGGASEARTTGNTASNPDLLQAAAGALSLAAHNAVTNQQQTNITAQAAATMGVATLYSIDTASTGVATKEILDAATHSAPQVDTATPVA